MKDRVEGYGTRRKRETKKKKKKKKKKTKKKKKKKEKERGEKERERGGRRGVTHPCSLLLVFFVTFLPWS